MTYEVEYTDEFGEWWGGLSEPEQVSVGDNRWYYTFVPIADKLYDEHLSLLAEEGGG